MLLTYLAVAAAVVACTGADTYYPPTIYGSPLSVRVVEKQGPDFRGLPVYLIDLQVETDEKQIVDTLVHRNYPEFEKLVDRVEELDNTTLSLPLESEASIEELNRLLQTIQALDKPAGSRLAVLWADFLSINWNADGVEWFQTMETFVYMLTFARVPEFIPEPSIIENEIEAFEPEVPFEKYVYMAAFRWEEIYESVDEYLEFFGNWTKTTPAFSGLEGEADVLPPNAEGPLEYPYHYTKTFVHFLPGGYNNGHTVRVSFNGMTKFNFLKEALLKEWIPQLIDDHQPKNVLDLGTGNCHSAFAYAELYPESEVIGIDLAAPYIRSCRLWRDIKGISNVEFYQDNGERTTFEDESFDVIQYSYVLHEMPADNADMVLRECLRLLTPGGKLVGFEVPWIESPLARPPYVASNTWGCDWNSTTCTQGPEPYVGEYQYNLHLPERLEELGFQNVTSIPYTAFDGIYVAQKAQA